MLIVEVGEPFNPSAVRQDVASLTNWYRNNGWPEASVQDRYTLSEDRTRAEVVYSRGGGDARLLREDHRAGQRRHGPRTDPAQVAWKEGEPFSEEKIADTQQNLSRTGVFRSIEVKPQPSIAESSVRNVAIDLTEARRLSLLYGFGYQYAAGADQNRNDVFGIVGGTYRNLFGKMRSASLELQYAPLSQRGHVFASFLEPYLFNTSVPLTFVAFMSRAPIQDIDIDRIGGYLESARLFRKYTRVALRYEYQQISPRNPEDLSTIELEKFPKSDQPIKQSAIGPSLFYDRRDDILDPNSGYYATVAGKYAFPFVNATARYGKVSGQAAWFRRFLGGVVGVSGRAARSSRTTWRRKCRCRSPSASSPEARRPAAASPPTCSGSRGSPSTPTPRPRFTPHRARAAGRGRTAPDLSEPGRLRLQPGPAHHRGQRLHGVEPGVPRPDPRQPRGLGLLRSRPGLGESRGHQLSHRGRNGHAPVDRRRPPLHDADRAPAARVRPAGPEPHDSLRRHGEAEPGRDRPATRRPTRPAASATGTTKEKGRILLSIGYPF